MNSQKVANYSFLVIFYSSPASIMREALLIWISWTRKDVMPFNSLIREGFIPDLLIQVAKERNEACHKIGKALSPIAGFVGGFTLTTYFSIRCLDSITAAFYAPRPYFS